MNSIMKMLKDPQAFARQAAEMQQKVASVTAKGSAGGGMVCVTINGAMEMLAVEIAPEVVDPQDVVILQDLVRAAYNDASSKIKQALQGEVAKSAGLGGMNPFGDGSGLGT
ncbi:MAG: nucleoid-associated protein, YbaB/EbfC family [Spirochaetes bacterium GWD1_61_31]|nr:MAG: nucleoid-associated protein, YbaB/EbfC family [Spirochaetes bacterium GWB1_60_80]OHD30069.1 MAG: nucleoid-associated protein, YbaB/EbfC family [Spirochaetes bacterium GWC1_61_12]OHD42572.1 MAG: nucleoid-associated protein, YbaB/EbfC family [Spirochaetes bacterium GWD1_61_31]OHD45077.1 MAG: nucleoid-associated protein, YbaB/EbfC family [Spirochaetes bacterium GWE1_60_18]OHD60004.1 MAG: nucleoid-associated protein, YbaB/EbfC family [Spirochaetes bacterium GWF1_60_12]